MNHQSHTPIFRYDTLHNCHLLVEFGIEFVWCWCQNEQPISYTSIQVWWHNTTAIYWRNFAFNLPDVGTRMNPPISYAYIQVWWHYTTVIYWRNFAFNLSDVSTGTGTRMNHPSHRCSDKKATVFAPMHTISTSGTPMILWVKIFCINTQFKN
jgi:hypothetical protein